MKIKKIMMLGIVGIFFVMQLSGCGTVTEAGSASDATEQTSISDEVQETAEVSDYSELLLGMSGDTTLADINEMPLAAELYTYWLTYYEKQVYDSYGEDVNWEQVADTVTATTLNDYVKAEALQTAATYILLEQKAEEYGTELTEEQIATLENLEETYKEEFGEEEYEQNLKLETVSMELLSYMQKIQYYHTNMMADLYAEGGDLYPTDEELQSYIDENGSYKVKYIWYENTDEDGNTLSEEKLEALKQEVAQKAETLQASEDPAAAFEELFAAENEDASESENGELAYSGRYTDSFEEAALALEENEISGVVEDEDYGFFIIERLPIDMSEVAAEYLEEAQSEKLNEWMQEADATTTDVYSEIDVEEYYEKLLTYLNEIDSETYHVPTQKTDE